MLTLDFRDLFIGVDVAQIMRDDLQDILHQEARDLAEIRLATTCVAIQQGGDD